jgi:hypothetical protein
MIASALAGALTAKFHTNCAMTRSNVPCAYLQRRLEAIQQMIASRSKAPAYLVIGDSLTERSRTGKQCAGMTLWQPVSAERVPVRDRRMQKASRTCSNLNL